MREKSITCDKASPPLRFEILPGFHPLDIIHELFVQEPELALSEDQVSELVSLLLQRAQQGALTWNRDVKVIKLHANVPMFELRLSFESKSGVWGARYFFLEEADSRDVILIGSHLKRPGINPVEQRAAQNLSISLAFKRYLEVTGDNHSIGT